MTPYTNICDTTDAIVCNSNNALRLWEAKYPKYVNKLHVIYNPFIYKAPIHINIDQEKCEEPIQIIVTASYQYLKNPVSLAKAITLLPEKEKGKIHIDWYGRQEVVQGDTRAYDEASRIVEVFDLGSTIALHGPSDNVYPLIAESDIVALFSAIEGLPNAIIEGMELGKPIIMTPVSDYEKLLSNDNGILCESDSPVDIANALIHVSSLNKEDRARMGANSKKLANSLFDSEQITSEWFELMKGLTEKKNNRD